MIQTNIAQQNISFQARIKLKPADKTKLLGNALLSTGVASAVGGNLASVGLYMDQSAHNYPILFSRYLPEPFLDFAKNSCLQKSAYEALYNPLGVGNETAALPGSMCSTIANTSGPHFIKNAKKINK